MQATHGLEKRKASKVGFCRFLMIFGVPREGRKSPKIEKGPSKTQAKKRTKKNRKSPPSGVECGGLRAAQGIQDSCSGRLLSSTENKFKARQHSRRSAADSFRSRDPRRLLMLKASKLLYHSTDQHKNIMLREREDKTLQMRSENLSGISSANRVLKWQSICA